MTFTTIQFLTRAHEIRLSDVILTNTKLKGSNYGKKSFSVKVRYYYFFIFKKEK